MKFYSLYWFLIKGEDEATGFFVSATPANLEKSSGPGSSYCSTALLESYPSPDIT